MKPSPIAPLVSVTSCVRKTPVFPSLNKFPRPVVDGDKIRSRLLRQLGIVPAAEEAKVTSRPVDMRKVEAFSEPLKYDGSDESGDDGSAMEKPKKYSTVAFEDEVSVIPIPRHQEYSQRIRSRLWCDKRELRTMAARNTIEYQSEGWNWRTVVDDDAFITTASGERIHPVHLRRLLSSPYVRQPLRILQQQHQLILHRQHQQQQYKSAPDGAACEKAVCSGEALPATAPNEIARQ